MRHLGAVWSQLNDACNKDEDGAAQKDESHRGDEHESARRAVLQEMFVRSAKNLLRRDMRGAMEMGAGPYEIEKIVSWTLTNLSPGDVASETHLGRVWHGVEQRFGVVVQDEQRTSVDVVRAVLRVAVATGVRLTQSCLDDLESEVRASGTWSGGICCWWWWWLR